MSRSRASPRSVSLLKSQTLGAATRNPDTGDPLTSLAVSNTVVTHVDGQANDFGGALS